MKKLSKKKLRLMTKLIWIFNVTLIISIFIGFLFLKYREIEPVKIETVKGTFKIEGQYISTDKKTKEKSYLTMFKLEDIYIESTSEKIYYKCTGKKKVDCTVSKMIYKKFTGTEIEYSLISIDS